MLSRSVVFSFAESSLPLYSNGRRRLHNATVCTVVIARKVRTSNVARPVADFSVCCVHQVTLVCELSLVVLFYVQCYLGIGSSRGSGVGISSRYRFLDIPVGIFSSRFGICCGYFKISRYQFGIFGISLCVKAPRAYPKILVPSQSANLT